jgi:lysophospholipase L1-like esterase
VTADATGARGYLTIFTIATADIPAAFVAEQTPAGPEPVSGFALDYRRTDPVYGPLGDHLMPGILRWRCDRLDRTFVAAGRSKTDGTVETASFSVRTPSCRDRLRLVTPRRVEPGDPIRVRLRDTWGTGLTSAEVCMADDCHTVDFGDSQYKRGTTFRSGKAGLRRIVVRAPSQVIARSVGVGERPPPEGADGPTVVTTGDSMMQSLDAILGDLVPDGTHVVSDVHVGTGLSSAEEGWYEVARKQVAATHPDATIVYLGANDFYDMQTHDGGTYACCGRGWRYEYKRRARNLMRIYAQRGAGRVLWLTLPTMRDDRRNPAVSAVNKAIVGAAASVPTAEVLRADRIFTPDGVFRKTLAVDGRQVVVREPDGIHLSIPGARIAADYVLDFLTRTGLV